MEDENHQSIEYFRKQIRVGQLPFKITTGEVNAFFEQFGVVDKVFLKHRATRDSHDLLPNPYAFVVFDKSDSVDQVMAARPLFMEECKLFIRRCLPIVDKYPYEAFTTVNKILIYTTPDRDNEGLPDDKSIIEYLKILNGNIEHFERLDDRTVLVRFNDYDPVDLCCLLRPHVIKNQLVEIEKCANEEQVRHYVDLQKKPHSISGKLPPTSTTTNMDDQTISTISPTPILSADDRIIQLRLTYNDITNQKEREHEQLVASLASELEKTTKERIRLQRLTLDYKNEHERLIQENRQWQKSFSDSIREKPNIQSEGQQKLQDACNKTKLAEEKYNKLIEKLQ